MKFIIFCLSIFILNSCVNGPLQPPNVGIKLLSCHDGDTCKFQSGNKIINVRVFGVDTPEVGSPFAKDARQFSENFLQNKEIHLDCKGRSYNRETCYVYANGEDLSRALVLAGLALDYPKYSKGQYAEAQAYAKKQKLGQWSSLSQNISPFCHRKGLKHPSCVDNPLFQP